MPLEVKLINASAHIIRFKNKWKVIKLLYDLIDLIYGMSSFLQIIMSDQALVITK